MEEAGDSDESLMRRYACGDARAFERLYGRHEMAIWRYLERSVKNRASAEELMQDVWFAVAREAGRYQASAQFRTWLFTIARNRLIDWVRSNRQPLSLDALGYEADVVASQLTADVGSGPVAVAVKRQQAGALKRALAELPTEQRDVFLMQVEGGFDVELIAAITGASFETTKSRLRYARTKLRELLEAYA